MLITSTEAEFNCLTYHSFVNTFNIINRQNITSFGSIILSVILQLSKIVKKTSPRRGGEEYIPRLLLPKPNTNMEKVTFNMLKIELFKSFYFNTNEQLSNEI